MGIDDIDGGVQIFMRDRISQAALIGVYNITEVRCTCSSMIQMVKYFATAEYDSSNFG